MAEPISAPFTTQDLTDLNEQLRQLDEADRLIVKAKQAGMDVGGNEVQSRELRTKLMRLKQTFFPGR